MAVLQEEKENIFDKFNVDNYFKAQDERVQKQIENEQKYCREIVSPDKLKEWQGKGEMTALEVWNRKNKWDLLPYVSTVRDAHKSHKIKHISDQLRQGAHISPEDRELFNQFVMDMAEMQTRGYTWGGQTVQTGLDTIPFVAEFIGGLLTTGGTASFGATATRVGVKKALAQVTKDIANNVAKDGILKTTMKGVGKTAYNATLNPHTYLFKYTRLPQQVWHTFEDMRVSDSLAVTPDGQAILKESQEHPAIAFLKASAMTNIEIASEMSGQLVLNPMLKGLDKVFAKPILRALPKTLKEGLIKLSLKTTGLPFVKAVDQLGWNGLLEEIGEERIGDLLTTAFNLDDKEGYSFEQFLDAMFPNISQGFGAFASEFASELVAFGVTGAGVNALHKGLSYNDKYTKDGFLIDAGIFKSPFGKSALDRKLEETLKKKSNLSEEDIQNVLNFATRDDKVQFLRNNGVIDDEQIQKINKLRENYYNQFKNANVDDETSYTTAGVYADTIAMTAQDLGMDIDELNERFNIKAQSMSDEEAYNQYQKDNTETLRDRVNKSQKDNDDFADWVNEYFESHPEENAGEIDKEFYDVKDYIENDNLPKEDAYRHGGLRELISDARVVLDTYNNMSELVEEERQERLSKAKTDEEKAKVEQQYQQAKETLKKQYTNSKNYILEKLNKLKEEWDSVEEVYFQSASSAGAGVNDIADAQREWEEKGTDSKYFKKFSDSAPVVTAKNAGTYNFKDNQKVVVQGYHGSSVAGIQEFDGNKTNYGHISHGFNFFTNNKNGEGESAGYYAGENGTVYECYISMKKPLVYDATGWKDEGTEYKTPVEFFDINKSEIKRTYNKGDYDGIIVKVGDNCIYAVPNSEQIKSVNNRGTFDSNSGNIYYQSMIAGIDGKQEVDVVDLSGQFSSDSTLTKKKLSAYIKTLIGNVNNLTDKDKKAIFDFVKKSKRIGKKDVYVPDHIAGSSKVENQYKGERNTFVNNILDLLENSTLIDVEKNTDKNKPNVDNYLRFYVPVKIGSDIYTVRVVAENNTGKNLFNILNADVYDVIVDKKMTASSPSTMGNLAKQSSNSIIPQNDENITSDKVTIEDMLRGVLDPDKKPYFQSMTKEQLLNVYMNQEFGMSADDITDMVTEDIKNILADYDVSEEEFKFEDIRIYGSYSKGTNKLGSDLDIVVQYSGSMREDSAFNMLHDEELSIYDKKGNKVKIDINPINTADHGTIDDYSKILFQSAYHGTPHRFDTFSTDNIGTGEGAQAHGWGLYFAENKNISEDYRKTLSDTNGIGTEIKVDNKTYKKVATNTYRNKDDLSESVDYHLNKALNFIETKGSKKDALKYIQKQIDTNKDAGYFDDAVYYIRIKDALNEIKQAKITKYADDYGQLFEVDIPDRDVLLDEDKPLNEQSEAVKKAILEYYKSRPNDYIVPKDINSLSQQRGKEFYKDVAFQLQRENSLAYRMANGLSTDVDNNFNAEKEASLLLNSLGIKGITYDGRQDGRCYVIFDDKAVNVLKTYYQEGEQGNSTEENIKGSRGFTYQKETGQNVIENIIVLLNNKADKSTLLHEFGHVYLNVMHDLARTNNKARERLLTIDKWLRHEQGSEYTTAQHEKFARGFVAYVKQGKAPNYSLKKAFEHFKKWLGDIRDILEANNELDIDPEGMTVFDEILGGNLHEENLQIAKEMYEDAKRYSQIKWAQEEDKKKKQAYFKEPDLTEWQKRYRDTAYDIVFTALQNTEEGRELVKNMNQLRMILGTTKGKTYYTKRNKTLKSQSEQIAKICANCGDALSRDGRGLALDEWSEFFKPISEDYTDEDLAIDAYDCIVQEDYLKRNDATDDPFADYYGDFYEGIVEESQYILDYLIDEYRNAEDKTIPLLAWNEFHTYIHEYIREDFEKKWENATAEIDRYQSLSQMQQAKEDLKIYAQVLRSQGDFHTQFRDYAKKILENLDFMTESDKEKVLNKLFEFNSFRDVEKQLDEVMDYAETLQQVTERRMLADDIRREVKETIHEWKNGIKKTKYTYPANKLFERLRELNRMNDEEIENLYAGFEEYTLDYTSDDVNDEDYYKTIEKMFIQYRINGRYYNSTAFLQDLLNKIQDAKFTAKLSRDEQDFERRMHQLNLVDECKNALDERRKEIDKNGSIKFMADLNAIGFNFNGALRMIFNDKIKGWASLDYLYAKKDGQVGKDRREFLDKAKELFGYNGKRGDFQLQSKLIDMTKKEFTITQYHSPDIVLGNYRVTENNKETGFNSTVKTEKLRQDNNTQWEPFTLELSRMELLYFYIQSKNPESYNILTDADKGQFNQIEFDNLLEELTPQERLLGDLMQMSAEKYWDALNAYHIKKYHVELGKVKNYFPRLTEQQEVNMLEMFNDYTQYSGNGKFQKQRTAGAGTRIAPANALAVLFDHMEKANTVVIMGEHLDLINKVFKNPDLKRELTNVWGDKVAKEFYGQLAGNLFSGMQQQKSIAEQWQGGIINNLIKVNIFFKAQIGIKQLISFMNYGKGDEYVSAGEWLKAFAKQTFTPAQWKKNIEFMMSNDYMRDRFSRGGSMDALKKQLENKFYAKLNLLDEIWGLPVALGDISAIILGGKPYIDVLMSKGYSKEDAFKIFIETTVNDQQSSIPSTLSNAQRNAGKNTLSKLFFAYQNTPWQYYRQCTSAIMNAIQDKKGKSILNAGKMVFLYGWLFPACFNMVSSLSPIELLAGGDDDDLLSDINPLRTLTSLLTQHPIIGDWIKGVLNAIDGKPFYSNDLIGQRVKQINKLISHVKKDKVTFMDIFNAISAIEETFIGQPLGAMGNTVSGIYDITQGDILKGTIKALGYSDHRASKVTNNEEN